MTKTEAWKNIQAAAAALREKLGYEITMPEAIRRIVENRPDLYQAYYGAEPDPVPAVNRAAALEQAQQRTVKRSCEEALLRKADAIQRTEKVDRIAAIMKAASTEESRRLVEISRGAYANEPVDDFLKRHAPSAAAQKPTPTPQTQAGESISPNALRKIAKGLKDILDGYDFFPKGTVEKAEALGERVTIWKRSVPIVGVTHGAQFKKLV
jgi:hypothetical protein